VHAGTSIRKNLTKSTPNLLPGRKFDGDLPPSRADQATGSAPGSPMIGASQKQGVSAASRPHDGVGVGQVRPDDVSPFEHTRVQLRGMASQKRGPGARLQKHLDDP
jgi:hypothetical protein